MPHEAVRFPVSLKGVVFLADRVVLLRNERAEWELPGGKLESGEDPVACLAREIEEELAIAAPPAEILDCWLYDIHGRAEVVIVTYGCRPMAGVEPGQLKASHEHKAFGLFQLGELADLPMPERYRRSIRAWRQRLDRGRQA